MKSYMITYLNTKNQRKVSIVRAVNNIAAEKKIRKARPNLIILQVEGDETYETF